MRKPDVDYRDFRFGKLNTSEFGHLKLLLFWPAFGLLFSFVERGWVERSFTVMHCALDDAIPFCEYFLIPYMFWFVFLVGMSLYSLLYDVETFRKFMKFIIITYSVTIIIYLLFPTAQELRPEAFARDNLFTRFITSFYEFDTNTNVCPSLHVIGSMAVMFAAWNSKDFRTPAWRTAFVLVTIAICLSTVFLKQHSVLDIPPALVISFAAYPLAFRTRKPVAVS